MPSPLMSIAGSDGAILGTGGNFSIVSQTPVTLYNPATQTIIANGNSTNITIGNVSACILSAVATGATGTTPTLSVFYDQQDAAGNWLVGLVTLTNLTPAVLQSTASFGVGIAGSPAAVLPAGTGRIRWVIGGTAPSFTGVQLSLIGR